MKRFSVLAVLVFALYAATILVAPYHYHHTNSDHLNCKLCQVSSQPTTLATSISIAIELHNFGFLHLSDGFVASDNITSLNFSRAPPAITF